MPLNGELSVILWNFSPHHVENPRIGHWQAMALEERHQTAEVLMVCNLFNAFLIEGNNEAFGCPKSISIVDVAVAHRVISQAILKVSKLSVSQSII